MGLRVVFYFILPFVSGMATMAAISLWRREVRSNRNVRRWLAMPPLRSLPVTRNRRTWAKPDGQPVDPDKTSFLIPKTWMPR